MTEETEPPDESLVAYRVEGSSMWPTLESGATVLVADAERCVALGRPWPPECGDIVVAKHPFRRDHLLVKRVAAVVGGRFDLRGESAIESEDSGSLGTFALDAIVGVVVGQP